MRPHSETLVIVEFYSQDEKYRSAVRKVLRQKKML